jgi:hypothetical protein
LSDNSEDSVIGTGRAICASKYDARERGWSRVEYA